MQIADIVARQIDLDDDLQTAKRVRVNRLDAAFAQRQLMQIHQIDAAERVVDEVSYAIAGQIEILDLGREVPRHLREVLFNALGGLLAGHPFALACRRALHPVFLALTQGDCKRRTEQPPARRSRYHLEESC